MRTTYESAMIDVTMKKARQTFDGRMSYLAWMELAVKVALHRCERGRRRAEGLPVYHERQAWIDKTPWMGDSHCRGNNIKDDPWGYRIRGRNHD